jgi:Resolvase, N terminal domain
LPYRRRYNAQQSILVRWRPTPATNVGNGKDSEARQRKANEGYAKSAGMVIVDWFYDKAVLGADAITERPGFAAMLDRIASNGGRTIIVESPDRFARVLAVQLAGHDHLRKLGVTLIPATAPDFFTEDTPTAVLVRQVLGAVAQFEKATTVAKLRQRATGRLLPARSAAAVRATPKRSRRWSSWPVSYVAPIQIVGRSRYGRLLPPLRSAGMSRRPAGHMKLQRSHLCSASRRRFCLSASP